MSVMVKICGMRSAADVAVAADAGADALGFVFAESPRRVTPEEARRAAREAPDYVIRAAVMLHPTNDEWQRVLDEFEPQVLQTDAADFASLSVPEHVECWPVIREGSADAAPAQTFLYEGRHSGRGETVDWQRAASFAANGRMILAGGLTADNVAAAIGVVRPYGVDVSSGVESRPGRKDPALVRKFIRAAHAAEESP